MNETQFYNLRVYAINKLGDRVLATKDFIAIDDMFFLTDTGVIRYSDYKITSNAHLSVMLDIRTGASFENMKSFIDSLA
jgi:hypothetical protein